MIVHLAQVVEKNGKLYEVERIINRREVCRVSI